MKINLVFILFLSSLFSSAQEQPKVGLVLSGGGAKGFAHIGVLKELEKAGVQIDYIGGTSMGGIIGGLYAAGYTAKQIEEIVESTKFMPLLQDEIPRREKPFFEKAYNEKHTIVLPIKKGNIGLPLGLSKGQNILNFLTELLAPVDTIEDFSKLPIPFYCIATDIENGTQIILEKGSLPLALRASGSFPSLLNPVEIDGKLLLDGGITNNFPIDVMKQKGVNIIIGVNVQGNLFNKENLSSVATVLAQIINFQMYKKADEQIKLVDIYLRPNIIEYNIISFKDKKAIIKEGVKIAKPYKPVFDSIAKMQTVKRPSVSINTKPKKILLDRIVINGNKNYNRNYILGKILIKEGDSTSYQEISKKINTLTATNNFERIEYRFENSFKGKKLVLQVKESTTKSFLRIGVHYDLLYQTGVLLNYNHKKLLLQNDELSLNFVIGDKIRYNLEYFIDNGVLLSYGFRSRYNTFNAGIIYNRNEINELNMRFQDFTNALYVQTTLDKKFAFGIGVEHKNIEASSKTILTNNKKTVFEDSNYINAISFLKLDSFNKSQFPTKGFYADINFTWYLWSDRGTDVSTFNNNSQAFSQFSQIDGTLSYAHTFWNKLTAQYTFETGYTLGKEKTQIFDYRLGGNNQNFINNFFPMYGYDVAQLSDQSFFRSDFEFRYSFIKKNYFTLNANYARISDDIFKNTNLFSNVKTGYAVGYGVETLIGPIQLKYSWSPESNRNFWLFNLGFWF